FNQNELALVQFERIANARRRTWGPERHSPSPDLADSGVLWRELSELVHVELSPGSHAPALAAGAGGARGAQDWSAAFDGPVSAVGASDRRERDRAPRRS